MEVTPNLLAKFSAYVYRDDIRVNDVFESFVIRCIIDDENGTYAILAENDTDTIIAVRGTEFDEWNDIKTNVDFRPMKLTIDSREIRLHRGYYESAIVLNAFHSKLDMEKPVWFTGHSLGGAVSTIAAMLLQARRKQFALKHDVTLVTFGTPKTHDKGLDGYARELRLRSFRYINIGDFIPEYWFFLHHHCPGLYWNGEKFVEKKETFWSSLWRLIKMFFTNKKAIMTGHNYDEYIRITEGQSF